MTCPDSNIVFKPFPTNRAAFRDLTGHQYDRWTVIGYLGKQRWYCLCRCGKYKSVKATHLTSDVSHSCGCLRAERSLAALTQHGMTHTTTYECWGGMKKRCNNPNHPAYKNYGGRGVKVCERWQQFKNFLADMGERPSTQYSLERINNDGDYEPQNCKWATRKEQANNKRNNRMITWRHKTDTVGMWAQMLDISHKSLYSRLSRLNWSMEKFLVRNPHILIAFNKGK